MKELVFFLEEYSARMMLEGFLPKLLPQGVLPRFVVFEGKQDLIKRLALKLRAWQNPQACFVVLLDKDASDCVITKNKIKRICDKENKPHVLIRIACHELESWYLGDLQAVEQGLQIAGLTSHQTKQKFRTPDKLANAAEELMKLTKNKYQKVSGSREIGPHLSLKHNYSVSFQIFVSGIQRLLTETV